MLIYYVVLFWFSIGIYGIVRDPRDACLRGLSGNLYLLCAYSLYRLPYVLGGGALWRSL